MKLHRTPHSPVCDREISSAEFWNSSFAEREETFRWLRENAPVSWQLPLEERDVPASVHGEAGFWALALAEDISFVSRNHDQFSSELGLPYLSPRAEGGSPLPASLLELDPPRHTAYRKVLSSAFTPKAIGLLTEQIEQRAEQIVDRVVGAGSFDFVAEVSSKLPMLTVADLIGIPEDQITAFAEAGNNLVERGDPETLTKLPAGVTPQDWGNQQVAFLMGMGAELADARRAHPKDDIMTRLVTADVDGRKLDNVDIGVMMLLLSVAGNDTTKQTTSHTVVNLVQHPEQRDWLLEDFDGRIMGAIEEFLRYATPVLTFARTATRDVTIRGVEITAGDKVGLLYCSGNRDSTVFSDPETFDITRPPTRHIAFGGGGAHYCIGAGVAKAQLRALFRQILTKLPKMEVGEPVQLIGGGMNGIKRLPVTVS
ncbi:cytochrome P450 [Nonomuraea insulae]|uniref:Cytochrome P450 n=1 Tax=Nonomuraea insulae TaxID=1616787 RepID=A0ABW1D128_9ACTN